MTTTALTTIQDTALPTTDHDPIERWDVAVGRYLETRKGGPEGNTAKSYERTLRAYKDLALESGLNPWAGDAIIAYNKLQSGLRKANGGYLADDTIAARLTHVQGFFRWAYIHGATPLTLEMVKGFIHKPRVKQLSPRDILDASEVAAMLRVAKSAEDPTQAKTEHALNQGHGRRGAEGVRGDQPESKGCLPGRWEVVSFRERQGGQVEGCGGVPGPGLRVAGAEGGRFCTSAEHVQENRPQVGKSHCQGSGGYKAGEPAHLAPYPRPQLAAGRLQPGSNELPPGPC